MIVEFPRRLLGDRPVKPAPYNPEEFREEHSMSIASPAADHPAGQATIMPQNRRLRQDDASDGDRNYSLAIHLSPLAGFAFPPLILLPLVLWLIRKNESIYVDDHGRESVNFCLSFLLLHVVLAITVVGLLLIPVLWVVGIVNLIRAAIAASNREYFRYPMTVRFIN